MSHQTNQYGEGAQNTRAQGTQAQGSNVNIDALQVESRSPGLGAVSQPSAPIGMDSNSSSGGLSFDQASAISFIISLVSYLWYVVPVMLLVCGEIFWQDIYKQFDQSRENNDSDSYDYWDNKEQKRYDTYMSYFIPFLIASICFIIASAVQVVIWVYSMMNGSKNAGLGGTLIERYKVLCGISALLSFIGCICQVIALGNLEDDTVGNSGFVSTENKSNDQLDKITWTEMLYGGFLLIYMLYNIYFNLLLLPPIGNNQFVRLIIVCLITITQCIAYFPFFTDVSNDYEDLAEQYEDYDDSSWYVSYVEYLRSISVQYGMVSAGLVVIAVACLGIIAMNIYCIFNYNNGYEVNSIAQLSSLRLKRGYLVSVVLLFVGLVFYLVGLGTTVTIFYLYWLTLLDFYSGFYVLFSIIVLVTDILSYKLVS